MSGRELVGQERNRGLEYLGAHQVTLAVSACLLGQRVRYDGGHRRHDWLVDELGPRVTWLPVCPEVELGLGVPRPPINLIRIPPRHEPEGRLSGADIKTDIRLIHSVSGRDLTADMRNHAAARVAELAARAIAGYVLKSKSPSCGVTGVKVFAGPGATAFERTFERSGRGLFAAVLLERLPDLPVIEDRDLDEPRARDEFVVRVCAYHRDMQVQ